MRTAGSGGREPASYHVFPGEGINEFHQRLFDAGTRCGVSPCDLEAFYTELLVPLTSGWSLLFPASCCLECACQVRQNNFGKIIGVIETENRNRQSGRPGTGNQGEPASSMILVVNGRSPCEDLMEKTSPYPEQGNPAKGIRMFFKSVCCMNTDILWADRCRCRPRDEGTIIIRVSFRIMRMPPSV